jgi:hypothetical protein
VKKTVTRAVWITLACALLTGAGCGPSAQPNPPAKPAAPSKPAIPDEMTAAAQAALGGEAEVLEYGDLALDGHQQALAVNRLKKAPEGAVPGTLVIRVVVVENDHGEWKEVLLADEHLKNPNGYLGGTHLSPVPAWRDRKSVV